MRTVFRRFVAGIGVATVAGALFFAQPALAGFTGDLSITLSASPATVIQGNNSVLTLTVRDTAGFSLPAGQVQVIDTIPTGLTFVSAPSPAGWSCTFTSPKVTCLNTVPVAPPTTAVFTVTVTGATLGAHTDTATVGITSCAGCDPTPADNTASTVVTVVAASTPTPTPTPTASAAPIAVPPTGAGAPHDDRGLPVGVALLLAGTIVAVAARRARRRA